MEYSPVVYLNTAEQLPYVDKSAAYDWRCPVPERSAVTHSRQLWSPWLNDAQMTPGCHRKIPCNPIHTRLMDITPHTLVHINLIKSHCLLSNFLFTKSRVLFSRQADTLMKQKNKLCAFGCRFVLLCSLQHPDSNETSLKKPLSICWAVVMHRFYWFSSFRANRQAMILAERVFINHPNHSSIFILTHSLFALFSLLPRPAALLWNRALRLSAWIKSNCKNKIRETLNGEQEVTKLKCDVWWYRSECDQ